MCHRCGTDETASYNPTTQSCNSCIPKKTPHKHAEIIKAWADGAVIEWKNHDGEWGALLYSSPSWDPSSEYRVQPPAPHKWQKEMDAQAAGKVVQFRPTPGKGNWINSDWWEFNSTSGEYRIKPEPVVKYCCAGEGWETRPTLTRGVMDNLKLTFEDGKLINAEVIS